MALTKHDRELLQRCLGKEPGAWKDFVDRFMGLFVHVVQHTAHCRSVRISRDDIDDLCADIFVAIVNNDFGVLRRYRGNSSLATYLTVIARRVVVRKISTRRMAEALGHVGAKSMQRADSKPQRSGFENREEVERLLAELPDRDATAVRMSFLEQKSYAEIAARLNVPENSIGPIISRAKEKMTSVRQVES
ncbi:MAG: RNA polymerase sigma factor [Planctomycetaceae bacterium]